MSIPLLPKSAELKPSGNPTPDNKGVALYLHLPFCVRKCHYCDFFSVVAEGQDIERLIDGILREAEVRAPEQPRTLFLGGGTPSLFSTAQLERLLNRIDDLTGFRAATGEVTAECNPESLDLEKAQCLVELGVARLSIGFQSLRAATLESFGRAHAVDDSFRAFEAARKGGAEAINIDMIYAVPGQTAAEWEADLERVLALGAEHLSAYNLTFEEGTRFKQLLDAGRMTKSPEELELDLFHATRRIATAAGLEAYEISNFAREDQRCLHNIGYWRNETYIGLGPGAVSKEGHTRHGNPRAIAPYLQAVEAGRPAQEWSETLDPAKRLAETWWLGLRLKEGVAPAQARATAGFECSGDAADPALDCARRIERSGQLEQVQGRWRLTAAGLPVADAVAARFLSDVSAAGGGQTAPV